jgi:SAM-dependent methyltransferase
MMIDELERTHLNREESAPRKHWDWVAEHDAEARRRQAGFHQQLIEAHRRWIPEGSSVVEWGCGRGDILAALKPWRGLGIDLSPRMIAMAKERLGDRPELEFRQGDIYGEGLQERFDHVVLNYLAGYLPDIQEALERLRECSHSRTRLHITTLNAVWRAPLRWAERFGYVMRQPPSNWLSVQDLRNLLELAGWEVVRAETEQLCPVQIPVIAPLLNRFFARLPLLRHLGVTQYLLARPRVEPTLTGKISVSVIVPARNEAGNIRAALERIPTMGAGTEVIMVEGNSRDDTWEVIQREIASYAGPHEVRAIQQPGKGKWDAVHAGFAIARGDILVIQDADLTAPPEDLPKFYQAVASGLAEFANGSRLVYPMESEAMRFLNLLGNKFFATALSYVLGQPVKDSLCGTKMLLRADYEQLLKRIREFGDFDPFGDFNLLFGASAMGLRIRDIPVRYRNRAYGETNISRFAHGWLLIKMTVFGLLRLRWR